MTDGLLPLHKYRKSSLFGWRRVRFEDGLQRLAQQQMRRYRNNRHRIPRLSPVFPSLSQFVPVRISASLNGREAILTFIDAGLQIRGTVNPAYWKGWTNLDSGQYGIVGNIAPLL